MSKLDRILVVSLAVAVAALALSGAWRGGRESVVNAADSDDNAPLDVVRRGLQFAEHTARSERDRAATLTGNSLSLGALRGEIDHAFSLFKVEHVRYRQLIKSSIQGDKQLAQDALRRSSDWLKVETTLRRMYVAEIEQRMKRALDDRERAKAARKRSDGWRAIEDEMEGMFQDEVKRLKAAPRGARSK